MYGGDYPIGQYKYSRQYEVDDMWAGHAGTTIYKVAGIKKASILQYMPQQFFSLKRVLIINYLERSFIQSMIELCAQ
ncbi:hypothetical protein GJV44_00183 [Candidatus Vallotia cooleyia]|nr:hypothetical protein GJV44_00183 [Candidatus Vallotia cooleyia]